MRIVFLLCAFMLLSCSQNQDLSDQELAKQDSRQIERQIIDFHQTLKRLYNGAPMNVDSLFHQYFDSNVYYVTYWGTTEPLDSTTSRISRALSFIKDYDNRVESISIHTFGKGASAFFVLRQTYELNGHLMDEYLPTTFVLQKKEDRWLVIHSHRSADFQTIQQLMNVARIEEKKK